MNAFALSSLLILIFSIAIGIFVYLKGRADKAAVVFSFFSFLVAFWGWGGYKIATAISKEEAFFWWQIAFLGVVSPVVYAHFVFSFLKLDRKLLLFVIYALAVIFIAFIFFVRNIFFGDLRFAFNQFYWIDWTKHKSPVYLSFYISFYWIVLTYFFSLLFKEYKISKGFRREQLKYIILGSVLGWIGGHCNFLPSFGVDFYPYPNLLIIIYVIIFAYAILRHQLMDIEVIIKKTLLFSSLFAFIYAIFAFFALLGQMFFERFITANRWLSMIPSVIIVTLTLRPLENFLVNATDKYLFQKKYDYKELLKTFASEVLSVLELDKLIKLTEEKLAEIMKLEYCKIVIAYDKDIKTEAELKMPISINNKQIGALLLGKKKSDEGYTHDDILILQSLSNTLAIAISNANLVDELTKAQIKMAEKDKMATIGTLAAGMAHEIRNPITTIRVFSEYVPDRLNDAEFINKYKNTVAKEVDKIDHIIQTLIDFSGEEDIQKVSGVSAYEAVEELVSIISKDKNILGRIQFINNIPPSIAKVIAIKEELDEIILNLTQNAIHAISEKGMITFNAEGAGRSVIIEISDTGNGMSEETIAHIFDPFFTTKSKGFGLGLFVVKELIQRNKGEIFVESRVGEGTKFRLRFNADYCRLKSTDDSI